MDSILTPFIRNVDADLAGAPVSAGDHAGLVKRLWDVAVLKVGRQNPHLDQDAVEAAITAAQAAYDLDLLAALDGCS